MECPKCKVPCPEGAVECPACGLIFAKWQALQAAQAPAAPAATPPATPEPVSGSNEALARYGAIALLVVALALGAYFLMKPGAPREDKPRETPWGVLGGKKGAPPAPAEPTQLPGI